MSFKCNGAETLALSAYMMIQHRFRCRDVSARAAVMLRRLAEKKLDTFHSSLADGLGVAGDFNARLYSTAQPHAPTYTGGRHAPCNSPKVYQSANGNMLASVSSLTTPPKWRIGPLDRPEIALLNMQLSSAHGERLEHPPP